MPSVVLTHSSEEADIIQNRVQGLQETVNDHLKSFQILDKVYCHNATQHGCVFCAVTVLVHMSIKNSDPRFVVNYKVFF